VWCWFLSVGWGVGVVFVFGGGGGLGVGGLPFWGVFHLIIIDKFSEIFEQEKNGHISIHLDLQTEKHQG